MNGRVAATRAMHDKARREAKRHQALRRGRISALSPLTVELEDYAIPITDDDFHLSQWMRFYDAKVGLAIDDVVLVHQGAVGWTLMDVVSDKAIGALG